MCFRFKRVPHLNSILSNFIYTAAVTVNSRSPDPQTGTGHWKMHLSLTLNPYTHRCSSRALFVSAIKEALESRGVLAQLKAGVRAEVFGALDNRGGPRPPLSHENLLVNELIREYLEFNKYRYTASVLTAGG